MNLYYVESDIRLKIDNLLLNAEENNLPAVVVNDTLEALQGELEVRQLSIAGYIKNLDVHIESIDAYIVAMQGRKQAANDRKQRLKDYLIDSMKRTGKQKIAGAEFTASIRESERVEVTEVTYLPDKFVRNKISVEPDKAKIKEAIKAGEKVEGAKLVKSENLIIK